MYIYLVQGMNIFIYLYQIHSGSTVDLWDHICCQELSKMIFTIYGIYLLISMTILERNLLISVTILEGKWLEISL